MPRQSIQEALGSAVSLGEITGSSTRHGARYENPGDLHPRKIPGSDFTWDVLSLDTTLGQVDVWVRSEVMQQIRGQAPV